MKPQIYRNSFPANLCFQRMRLLVAVALVALPLFWNVTVRTETAAGEFYPITGNDVLVTTSALSGAPIAATITFTVINTNDSGPGTLRQAILDANDNLGADIIAFGIPGPGPHTIAPTTALPEVTDPLTIDGTTQPGYSGKPVIELSGVNAGIGVDGLCVIFPGTVIRALAINRFGGNGIKLVEGDDTLIVGNFIGTDVTGTIGLGNGGSGIFSTNDGLKVGGWTPAARNVISGNGRYGIETSGGGPTIVEGNLIGTDVTGTKPLGNSAGGVSLFGGVFNRVGGTTDGSRNVISANGGIGLECFLAGEVMIQGNHIGTDVSGRRPLGNAGDGVVVSESSSLIGGPTPSSRNIISANGGSGMRTGMGEETNRIEGNFIGTDVTGTRDLGNAGDGVVMNDIAGALGGATPEFGNLISGNDGNGVTLNRFHTSVSNNLIGTDRSGTRPLGNSRNGIFIANGDNSIESNTIAFNGEAGVLDLGPEAQDLFLFNSIFSNGGIGIDLGSTAPAADGPTPNDPCDVDDGPNHLQNFPVLTAVSLSAGGIR
ncbi:MAG TPA: right-handed parallel beta-helix repeat-containing protein, partial [Blastocatellia bacterium]|nr:right-handed parallel beta-helix repeat-containing protein [Blastocatellia bacterium]